MSDLVEFLLARIAEDEQAAREASGEGAYLHIGDTAAEECWRMAKAEGCAAEGYRFHRRHDPARVLAECEAKRRIVTDRGFLDIHGILSIFGARILGYMAEPYRDHPDYDEAWRP